MSESEFEGKPVIRDKRRIDPETGQRREEMPEATEPGAVSPDGAPAGGAPEASDDESPAEPDPVAEAKAEAADLFDQLQRAKADLYNLDQRFNNYVRRSRAEVESAQNLGVADVVETLIPVLDDIAAAREHEELSGPFGAIAEKLESSLAGKYGVARFGTVGEPFDPEVHEALMHEHSEEATENTIATVLQPGYRVGDRVVRPARVAVSGPQ
ncbi:nucleotide exchange factor GrpE [Pseudactinotalea sp. Z1748]|uniref:nucleotide exchange factor GrpE n=1 Tax=Pseudactinotalea sp. Z1748 TaxID=3413027 RepID=UPI003C7DA994